MRALKGFSLVLAWGLSLDSGRVEAAGPFESLGRSLGRSCDQAISFMVDTSRGERPRKITFGDFVLALESLPENKYLILKLSNHEYWHLSKNAALRFGIEAGDNGYIVRSLSYSFEELSAYWPALDEMHLSNSNVAVWPRDDHGRLKNLTFGQVAGVLPTIFGDFETAWLEFRVGTYAHNSGDLGLPHSLIDHMIQDLRANKQLPIAGEHYDIDGDFRNLGPQNRFRFVLPEYATKDDFFTGKTFIVPIAIGLAFALASHPLEGLKPWPLMIFANFLAGFMGGSCLKFVHWITKRIRFQFRRVHDARQDLIDLALRRTHPPASPSPFHLDTLSAGP